MSNTYKIREGYVYSDINDVQVDVVEQVVVPEQSTHTLKVLDERIAELEGIIFPNLAIDRANRVAQLQAQIDRMNDPVQIAKEEGEVMAKINRLKEIRAGVATEAGKAELVVPEPEPEEPVVEEPKL